MTSFGAKVCVIVVWRWMCQGLCFLSYFERSGSHPVSLQMVFTRAELWSGPTCRTGQKTDENNPKPGQTNMVEDDQHRKPVSSLNQHDSMNPLILRPPAWSVDTESK